jgi:hypothetical protein
MRGSALKPDLFVPGEGKAGKNSPASPAPARFRKGRAYQFKSSNYKNVTVFSNMGISSIRYEFLSEEQGSGTKLFLFRSANGGWRESFTPCQLEGYEIREAK